MRLIAWRNEEPWRKHISHMMVGSSGSKPALASCLPSPTTTSLTTPSQWCRVILSTYHHTALIAVRFPEGVGQPFETLIQTVTGGSAGRLDELDGLVSESHRKNIDCTHPSTAGQALQAKLLGNLGGTHSILERSVSTPPSCRSTYRQILLVGENKEKGIAKFILIQHTLQLFPRLDDTVAIVAVHHEDDTLGVLEVMPPQRTDFVLTTDIPHGELNVLVLDSLDVETFRPVSSNQTRDPTCGVRCGVPGKPARARRGLTDCGNGGDDFTQLQLVQNSGLSCSVETDHENAHLLSSP